MNRTLLKLYYTGPLVAWMLVIFMLSTRAGDPYNSLGMVGWFLKKFTPFYYSNLNSYQLAAHNYMFRKACHFTEYFVLTLLAVRALQSGRPDLKPIAFLSAAALSVGYALADEAHQYFVAGRTASPMDVAIDGSGTIVCLIGILGFFAIKRLERTLQNRVLVEAEIAAAREAAETSAAARNRAESGVVPGER